MKRTITYIDARDIRFTTSCNLDGSGSMNPDTDFSAVFEYADHFHEHFLDPVTIQKGGFLP